MAEHLLKPRKASTVPSLAPRQGLPLQDADPLAVQYQALQRHTTRSLGIQRQVVQPVLRAAALCAQEEERVEAPRAALQRQAAEIAAHLPEQAIETALQRHAERMAPVVAPVRPQAPADWVTVMRVRARQVQAQQEAGRGLDAREAAQFTALQRQVTQNLVQGWRQDRQAPEARSTQYAEHLVHLQRELLSAPVARVVLGMLPQGERPSLQRDVAVAMQREREQAVQDGHALNLHALQRQLAELDAEASQPVFQRIQARRGAGNPLPEAVQRHLEQGLNHDLSRVRIHADAEADLLAKGVNATAFTIGTDIFFRSGKYEPNSRSGLELLAHEVTHTVQQAQRKVGAGVDPDAGLEAEARSTGARLASQPLKLEGVKGRTGLAPLTTGHAIQRRAAPPSWKVSASPEMLEQMVQKDLSGFLRQMLGGSLLDQTHYSAVNRGNPRASPPFGRIFLDSLDHLPISAASKQKVLDGAIQKPFLPDWTRVQIAQSAIQTKRTDVARAQSVMKAIAAKAARPDHLTDFGGALLSRVVDTVVSLYKLAKFVQWDNSVVRMLVDPVGYQQMWVNIGATLSTVVRTPRLLWDALSKDVREAWEKGQYGKSLGYLTFDVATVATGLPGAGRAAATVPGRMRVVVAVAKDASGRITSKVVKVGDDVARGMEMTAQGAGGRRTAEATTGGRGAAPARSETTSSRMTATGPTTTGALPDPGPLMGLARQLALAQRCVNWADVKPFVGAKAGPTHLPPGYLYAKIPLHGGGFDEFAYLSDSIKGAVPKLKRDPDGHWQPAGLSWDRRTNGYGVSRDYRLAQSSEYNKTNPPPTGFSGATNNHHLTPDNVMRGSQVFQEAFGQGLLSPDRAPNMLHLAVNPQVLTKLRQSGITMSDVLHYTSHAKYDDRVRARLADLIADWQAETPPKLPLDLGKATPAQLRSFVGEFDKTMRASFFTDMQWLQKVLRADNSLSALPNQEGNQA